VAQGGQPAEEGRWSEDEVRPSVRSALAPELRFLAEAVLASAREMPRLVKEVP